MCEQLGFGTQEALKLYQKANVAAQGCGLGLVLPQIIIAAKQSAGKSSVLTQLLGGSVRFPSQQGTCTRCPAVVHSKHTDGPRVCRFSLRFFWDDTNSRELEEPFTREEVAKQIDVDSWSDIPIEILRLQAKVLEGPNHDLKLEFSHNEVVLAVEGSDLPDLSIKDLPGLVSGATSSTRESVQSITEHAMRVQNAIIIACLTCNDDIENQLVLQLASKYDKNGMRTIGVLTKPDRVESCGDEQVMKILNNNHPNAKLHFGWYVVRGPAQNEKAAADFDNSKARETEIQFFSDDPTGVKMKQSQPDRCGIDKLLLRASHIIASLVHAQVPELLEIMQDEYERTQRRLKEIGLVVTEDNIREYLFDVIGIVGNLVRQRARCEGQEKRSLWHDMNSQFAMARTAFKASQPRYGAPGGLHYPSSSEAPPAADRTLSPEGNDAEHEDSPQQIWMFDAVRKLLKEGEGRELYATNNINYAGCRMIVASLSKWYGPTMQCLRGIKQLLQEFCSQIVDDIGYDGHLAVLLKRHMKALIKELAETSDAHCQKLLRLYGCHRDHPNFTWVNKEELRELMDRHIDEIRCLSNKPLATKDIVVVPVPSPKKNRNWFALSGGVALLLGGVALGSSPKFGSIVGDLLGVDHGSRRVIGGVVGGVVGASCGSLLLYNCSETVSPAAVVASTGASDDSGARILPWRSPNAVHPEEDQEDVWKAIALAIAYCELRARDYSNQLSLCLIDELLESFTCKLEKKLRDEFEVLSATPKDLLEKMFGEDVFEKQRNLQRRMERQKEAVIEIENYLINHVRGFESVGQPADANGGSHAFRE